MPLLVLLLPPPLPLLLPLPVPPPLLPLPPSCRCCTIHLYTPLAISRPPTDFINSQWTVCDREYNVPAMAHCKKLKCQHALTKAQLHDALVNVSSRALGCCLGAAGGGRGCRCAAQRSTQRGVLRCGAIAALSQQGRAAQLQREGGSAAAEGGPARQSLAAPLHTHAAVKVTGTSRWQRIPSVGC